MVTAASYDGGFPVRLLVNDSTFALENSLNDTRQSLETVVIVEWDTVDGE